MDIVRVQRWVASVIVLVVGMAPTVALAIASTLMSGDPETQQASRGLWVMSGIVGVVTIGGVLLIHRRSPLSPWLCIGLLPAAVATFFRA